MLQMKCFYLLLFTSISLSSFGQTFIRPKFEFSVEYKSKRDIALRVKSYPYPYGVVDKEKSFNFLFAWRFHKIFGIETGYFKEYYEKGYIISPWKDYVFHIPVSRKRHFLAHHIPLRLKTDFYGFSIFKKPASVCAAAGPVVGISGTSLHGGGSLQFSDSSDGNTLTGIEYEREGIEYDIQNLFVLLDARLQVRYFLADIMFLTAGGGYSQGFATIGRVNTGYMINGGPEQFIRRDFKGSAYYFNVGLGFYFQKK